VPVRDEEVHELGLLAAAFLLALRLDQLEYLRHARTEEPDEECIGDTAFGSELSFGVVLER
jgi:hypothetical protein